MNCITGFVWFVYSVSDLTGSRSLFTVQLFNTGKLSGGTYDNHTPIILLN